MVFGYFVTNLPYLASTRQQLVRDATTSRSIYPTLVAGSAASLKPLTESQLRSLYYNHELEHSEEYITDFLQVMFRTIIQVFF